MFVKELKPGSLIKLDEDMVCYTQESRTSNIPRLRIVKSIIGNFLSLQHIKSSTMIYMGESSEFIKKRHRGKYTKQRLVMIDGCMAFIQGSEFKHLNPISS
jgi:hypothetical protein